MIERILPEGVSVAEIRGLAGHDRSHPVADAAQAAGTAPKRQAQFAAGRACARAALSALEVPPVAIPSGPGGEPRWPPGVVGSITHCDGYVGAAVCRSGVLTAIGIDAEPDRALPPGILPLVATPEERAALPRRSSASDPHWDRLLFSAKEAVFKAWYPLTALWIGFDAATVEIDPTGGSSGSFVARFVHPVAMPVAGAPVGCLQGRWLADHGLIACAVTLASAAQAAMASSTSSRAARLWPLTNESTWGRAAAIPPTSGR